jgi:hypothetical protein
MLRFAIVAALCGLALICQTAAQQFSDVPQPVNYPGISDGCFHALNTTVKSPGRFLPSISIEYVSFAVFVYATPCLITDLSSNPLLTSDQLSELCTPECESTLNTVRGIVAQGCAGETITFIENPEPGE